jgi:hypothetical protein
MQHAQATTAPAAGELATVAVAVVVAVVVVVVVVV